MDWIRNNRRFATIVGVTLALPLFIVLSIILDLWGVRQGYQKQIDQLEPRVARLMGLIDSEQKLSKSSGKVGSRLMRLVYPPEEAPSTIAAALQTSVRDIAAGAGLRVGNSRILPGRTIEGFDQIGLSLTVTGEMVALDQALIDLANFTPVLLVESIEIKPSRPTRRSATPPGQSMVATLQLLTLRVQP